MQIIFEVVRHRHRLAELAPAWNKLWQQNGRHLFQSHAWIAAWCDDAGADATPQIGCAWQGDDLIAVLPLCVRSWRGLRVLEWAAQSYSDYCDALLLPFAKQALESLWLTLTQTADFDVIRLKHIETNAIIQPLVQHFGMSEERVEVSLQVANQWANGQAWFRNLNKKTRNNHTRGKRILGESGTITIRQLADHEPREPVIHRLLDLKRRWASNRDSPLVRTDTTLLALTKALDQIDCLRVFLIECDGAIIAGSVNAVHHNKMLALFATYDPAYDRSGPGIILMTEYTMWAFDQGITEIDYLLGAEPYKFKFANQESNLHIYVKAMTIRGRVALAAYQWLQRRRKPDAVAAIGSAYLTEKGTPRQPTAKEAALSDH